MIEAEVVAPPQPDAGGYYRGPPPAASRRLPQEEPEEVRLQNLLEAEAREKEGLLQEQRQQQLELEDLRRRQKELQLMQSANSAESAKTQTLVQSRTEDAKAAEAPSREGLMNAIRLTGVRPAPEYGGDMFVASLPQIGKVVRLQLEKAKRAHLAGMQALRRYVVQLETDLDSKDEEATAAAGRLEEEKRLRFKAEEAALQALSQPPVSLAQSTSSAAEVAAAEAEVARLQEELLAARQGAEVAQTQLAQESQRAEAAETKLRALVERIRGASSKR